MTAVLDQGAVALQKENTFRWAEIITRQQATRESFKYLQQSIDEYNHEPSQSQWESIKAQKLRAEEAVRLTREAKEERYPSVTGPKTYGQRVREKFDTLCNHISDYSFILDAVAQLYPGWESAVWGSLKFLITAKIKYQKLKEQVTVHLGDIGENLSLVAMLLRLYPSEEMCDHVSGVYTELAAFLTKAIKFYKASRIKRAAQAAFGDCTFDEVARFKSHIDSIKQRAFAQQGAGIEHLKLQAEEHEIGLHKIQSMIESQDGRLENRLRTFGDSLMTGVNGQLETTSHGVITGFKALFQDAISEVRSQETKRKDHRPFRSSELTEKMFLGTKPHVRTILFPELDEVDNDYEETLFMSRLIPTESSYKSMGLLRLDDINEWVESQKSGLLWMNGFLQGRHQWTTEFAVDLISTAQRYDYKVVFYFCAEHYASEHSDYLKQPKAIIHSFIFQLLQHHQDHVKLSADRLNADQLSIARTDFQESWKILVDILSLVDPPVLYIVLDSIDVIHPDYSSYPKSDFEELVQGLQDLAAASPQIIKILVTTREAREYSGLSTTSANAGQQRIVDVPPSLGHGHFPLLAPDSHARAWAPPIPNRSPTPELETKPPGRMSTWDQLVEESKQHRAEEEQWKILR